MGFNSAFKGLSNNFGSACYAADFRGSQLYVFGVKTVLKLGDSVYMRESKI